MKTHTEPPAGSRSSNGLDVRIGDIRDVLEKNWTGKRFLEELIRIDYELLDGMTDHQEGNSDQWAPVFMDHPDTWRLLLNSKNDIVGYWHFVPLFEDFLAAVKAGTFLDSMITSDHVPHLELPGWYDIYFVQTAILPIYRGAMATKLLFASLEQLLEQLAEQGTFVRNICANAFTPAGVSLCRTLGLKFLRNHVERGEIYLADFDTVLKSSVLGRNKRLLELYRRAWQDDEANAPAFRPQSFFQDPVADRQTPRLILSGELKDEAELQDAFVRWFEELPFPLASIARAWLVEPGHDYKAKYEHLLHFFEASAQFTSVILLSAFSSKTDQFEHHRRKILAEMTAQKLSLHRSTFGTWKLIVEYFGKQTRQLLNQSNDTKTLCEELFCDPTLSLARAVSHKELVAVYAATNTMRNDWRGHSGVVSVEEAKLRNNQLLREVKKLRQVFADCWRKVQLLGAANSKLRRGMYDNEVTVLMGSNSEFLRQNRILDIPLEVERLYLCSAESTKALQLMPLIQVGPSPQSVKNACYFFSRLERDGGARFISYHYLDHPELMGVFDQATDAIKLLSAAPPQPPAL